MHLSKLIATCVVTVAALYSSIASADLYSFTSPGAVGQYTYQAGSGGLSGFTDFSLTYDGLTFSCATSCDTQYIVPTYLLPLASVASLPGFQITGTFSSIRILSPNDNPHNWAFDTSLDYVYLDNQQELQDGNFYDSGILSTVRVQQPSAVPVPAALPLMASGLAAFGLARRRKKNV